MRHTLTPVVSATRAFSEKAVQVAAGADAGPMIRAACVLERLPIVMPPPPAWEVDYKQWVWEWRTSQNYYKTLPKTKKQEQRAGKALDAAAKAEQESAGSPQQGVPAPGSCLTKADATGDLRTMKRKLDQKLFLLVRGTDRSEQRKWAFPHAEHMESETIRETGERALKAELGDQVPAIFIGNAPMAHFDMLQDDRVVRTFFMLAQAINDPWDVNAFAQQGKNEYAWVTVEEMKDMLEPGMLALAKMML